MLYVCKCAAQSCHLLHVLNYVLRNVLHNGMKNGKWKMENDSSQLSTKTTIKASPASKLPTSEWLVILRTERSLRLMTRCQFAQRYSQSVFHFFVTWWTPPPSPLSAYCVHETDLAVDPFCKWRSLCSLLVAKPRLSPVLQSCYSAITQCAVHLFSFAVHHHH